MHWERQAPVRHLAGSEAILLLCFSVCSHKLIAAQQIKAFHCKPNQQLKSRLKNYLISPPKTNCLFRSLEALLTAGGDNSNSRDGDLEEGESYLGRRRSGHIVCRTETLKIKKSAEGKLNAEREGRALCWSNREQ